MRFQFLHHPDAVQFQLLEEIDLQERILIRKLLLYCGDGLAIARLLHVCVKPAMLDVVLGCHPDQLNGDASANFAMLRASGFEAIHDHVPEEARGATLLIDAVLGTGIEGDARGRAADLILEMSFGFPHAKICAVDLPSGMSSDSGESGTPVARADVTVTFTAPKLCHALPPNCDRVGKLIVGRIGSSDALMDAVPRNWLTRAAFSELLEPRARAGHKGTYGHVLVIAGSRFKPGAAALAGMAALRAGAGLVTVASEGALGVIASLALCAVTVTRVQPQAALLLILSGTTTSGGVRMGFGSSQTITEDDAIAIGREMTSARPRIDTMRSRAALISRSVTRPSALATWPISSTTSIAAQVTSCEPRSPMRRPKKPAMKDARSGRKIAAITAMALNPSSG